MIFNTTKQLTNPKIAGQLNSNIRSEMSNTTQEQIRLALQMLKSAQLSSKRCQRDPLEFAIEISELTKAGIAKHVLMHLVCQRDVIHLRETTTPGLSSRTFVQQADLVLSSSSCFVLSEQGATKFEDDNLPLEPYVSNLPQDSNLSQGVANEAEPEIRRPEWDTVRRELRINGIVVKNLRWPAANQECVLDAFSSLNWPVRIDDPLPTAESICPKRRLHDTIKCLNRKQKNPIIKFRGDGTGRGVLLQINKDELKKALKAQTEQEC